MTVNSIRKKSYNEEVNNLTKVLIKKWKKFIPGMKNLIILIKFNPNWYFFYVLIFILLTLVMQSIKYITFIILSANPKESSQSESKAPEKMSETKEKHTKEFPDSKEKRGSTSTGDGAVPVSFPALPSTTIDPVRLKCRGLLCTAIKGDGLPVDGRNNNWLQKLI